eukprot:m51a1_g1808 hypothetical protein (487) ;mRNA; r:476097-477557
MFTASVASILLLAAAVAAYPLCGASGGSNCQMGFSTVGPAGPATGGEGAPASMTFTVSNRAEFVAAVGKTGKKIIYVSGTIRGDDLGGGQVADMAYFAGKTGYDFQKYLDNPASMEEKRKAVLALQGPLIIVDLTDDTSIIGLGKDAKIQQMNLRFKRVSNVVIRNIEFEAPRDYATAWSSDDGWNAEYDSITVEGSTRLWFDHLTFSDGRFPDSKGGVYKGKHIQWHDGLLDLKRATDFVTISNCVFAEHDKTNLVGSSDSLAAVDAGHLRITFYRNVWSNTVSRAPRVRFGKVHVLSNYYKEGPDTSYFIGMGVECSVLSEGNVFEAAKDSTIIQNFKGKLFKDSGSWFNGQPYSTQIQALAGSGSDAIGWSPEYKYAVPTDVTATKNDVLANAGAGKLDTSDISVTSNVPDVSSVVAKSSAHSGATTSSSKGHGGDSGATTPSSKGHGGDSGAAQSQDGPFNSAPAAVAGAMCVVSAVVSAAM